MATEVEALGEWLLTNVQQNIKNLLGADQVSFNPSYRFFENDDAVYFIMFEGESADSSPWEAGTEYGSTVRPTAPYYEGDVSDLGFRMAKALKTTVDIWLRRNPE